MNAPAQTFQGASLKFWADFWRQKRGNFHLKQTQLLTPKKWRLLYDRVPDLGGRITGASPAAGENIAGFMAGGRLCTPGDSDLGIGCGPGNLSFALSERGMMVTTLDYSTDMIQCVRDKIRRENIIDVKTVLADWRRFLPKPRYDLAAACFFLDAFSPESLAPHGIICLRQMPYGAWGWER